MRYFLSFLVALGLLVLVIFLLFRDGDKPKSVEAPLTVQNLVDYASSGSEAVMTIDGPVNYVKDHQQVRVTVNRDNVTYEQLQGYSGDAIKVHNFANTQDAYAVFLKSLAHLGFTKGNNDPKGRDERGFCPAGDRYIFEFRQDGQELQRYWATTCGGAKTYLGFVSPTVDLFTAQVPGYQDLTEDIEL